MHRVSRRAAIATASSMLLAGCLDQMETPVSGIPIRSSEPDDNAPDGPRVPTTGRDLPLPADLETMEDGMMRGAQMDAIPAIDFPEFTTADEGDELLEPGDPIIGLERDGITRAYAQHILVWHEIVNEVVDGEGVAITYCPLTGTAQGYLRGDIEFGVSGMLLNSNLIMYDRAEFTYWPQMLGTGLRGPQSGDELVEFDLVWTTWERWRAVHPDTEVLTENTGFARDYSRDPYGSYNPRDGYYANERLLFPPFSDGTGHDIHPKKSFLGARTADGAIAVSKETLASEHLLKGSLNDVIYLFVYDEALDSGWCYRNPGELDVREDDGDIRVDGTRYPPDGLPLESVVRYDVMWFAWEGYYPETEVLT